METWYKASHQIQPLIKAVYSLNNNGKNDTFIKVAGLFVHNSSINSVFTKPSILDSGATNHIASYSQFSHTFHHYLFQMLICPQLRPFDLRAHLNSMTISLSKIRSFFVFLILI